MRPKIEKSTTTQPTAATTENAPSARRSRRKPDDTLAPADTGAPVDTIANAAKNAPMWLDDYRAHMPPLPAQSALILVQGAAEHLARFSASGAVVPHQAVQGGETVQLQRGQPLVLEVRGKPSQCIDWHIDIVDHPVPPVKRFRYNIVPSELQNRIMGGLQDLDRYTWTPEEVQALGDKFTVRITAETPRRKIEQVLHFEVS